MKKVLAHCAALAHLDVTDAYKLEQDICDMINMAGNLSELDLDEQNREDALPIETFRSDEVSNKESDEKLFENATYTRNGCLCVPRLTGV